VNFLFCHGILQWLAAKEELHSSEEDEEDKALFDLEAIEKKRQKEIEEWRSQQLASGGALENANFQPLGTLDWFVSTGHYFLVDRL
jgi:hypothetical protein